jgi:hypothetical protein
MVLPIETIFILIGIDLLVIGILYAVQILLAPSPHGWTFISVGLGTSIIVFAETFLIYVIQTQGESWMYYVVPPAALLIMGLPMAVTQLAKKVYEDRRNKQILRDNGLVDEQALD